MEPISVASSARLSRRFHRFRLGRAAALVLGAVALLRCASAPPAPAGRTVVISFDGLGGVRLNELLSQGNLAAGGFSAIAERGLLAGRAVDVTPSLTPAAHIAAITGAPPGRNGIVANHFREPGSPFGADTTGFLAPIETETLWEAAHRQGRRVGVLLYPGADGTDARRRGDFGLTWPDQPAKQSAFVTLDGGRWTGADETDAASFSPVRRTTVDVAAPGGRTIRLDIRARDTTDDGVVDYDTLIVARPDGTQAPVKRLGWFAVQAPGEDGPFTAWCRVVALEPTLARVVVYVGGFFSVPAYPPAFRARFEAALGGWPGPPDPAIVRAGPPDEGDAAGEEQAQRLAEYLTRAIVFAIRNEHWDLLVAYQPLVDEIEHHFEPGPRGGSAEAVTRAFQTADRCVAAMLATLAARDSLLILSDHGMVPLEKAIDLERYLEEKGWTIARKAPAPGGLRAVQVCASSGIAHVYVDPALSPAARAEASAALARDLEGLSALPGNLVDAIVPRGALAPFELDNPRSGDVVVLLCPGIDFAHSKSSVLSVPTNRGGHGYRNATAVLDASFAAIGPGIEPSRPATISLLEVASRAARALGIDPPRGAVPAGR
jgi:predicted AlkP superfamily pyrophosphatase or phosphodiesterase